MLLLYTCLALVDPKLSIVFWKLVTVCTEKWEALDRAHDTLWSHTRGVGFRSDADSPAYRQALLHLSFPDVVGGHGRSRAVGVWSSGTVWPVGSVEQLRREVSERWPCAWKRAEWSVPESSLGHPTPPCSQRLQASGWCVAGGAATHAEV